MLNMRDVSERVAMENELRHQAFHDALTGLANRALFEDRLRHALAAGLGVNVRWRCCSLISTISRRSTTVSGMAPATPWLRNVAARIDPLVRPTDTAARLGGDEFAVLLEGILNAQGGAGQSRRGSLTH